MKLTVKPLKQKDAGRGLAAIDRTAADELGLEGGDYIHINGRGGTAIARVWPGYPEDSGSGVIRIDGQLRQQAEVGIDDKVEVEKADVKPAKRVTIALPQNLRIGGNVGPYVRDKMSGQAVTTGQTIRFPLGFGFMGGQSQAVPMKIAKTEPSGTVIITDSTEVEISEKPAEQFRGAAGSGNGPYAAARCWSIIRVSVSLVLSFSLLSWLRARSSIGAVPFSAAMTRFSSCW